MRIYKNGKTPARVARPAPNFFQHIRSEIAGRSFSSRKCLKQFVSAGETILNRHETIVKQYFRIVNQYFRIVNQYFRIVNQYFRIVKQCFRIVNRCFSIKFSREFILSSCFRVVKCHDGIDRMTVRLLFGR